MTTYGEVLAQQDDVVTSPDGNIKARVTGGEVKDIEFRPNTFETYGDAALAQQLEYFSRLVAIQRRRSRRTALRESLGGWEPEPTTPDSPQAREAKEQEKNIEVLVRTANIKVHLPDPYTWRISIKPGTTKNVPEEDFKREIAHATKQVIADLRFQLHGMRDRVFGPSFIYQGMVDRGK